MVTTSRLWTPETFKEPGGNDWEGEAQETGEYETRFLSSESKVCLGGSPPLRRKQRRGNEHCGVGPAWGDYSGSTGVNSGSTYNPAGNFLGYDLEKKAFEIIPAAKI